MVQLNPKVRIAPSGPIADNEDPFAEYAGAVYFGQHLTVGGNSVLTTIGPLGDIESVSLARSGKPVSQVAAANLVPNDSPSNLFGFTAGLWKVDCQIEVGFQTTVPSTVAEFGGLAALVNLVNSSNAVAATGPCGLTHIAPSPIARKTLQTYSMAAVTLTAFVELDDADIAANANLPLEGLELVISRVAGSAPGLDYTANSGILVVGSDTQVSISKFR